MSRTAADIDAELARIAAWQGPNGQTYPVPPLDVAAMKADPNGQLANDVFAALARTYPK